MSTNAIIAGGGNGIRIRGTTGKAAVYGSRMDKGDFIRCVNFPYNLHSIDSIADPEYTETTVNGPTYIFLSDNILVKFWRDQIFPTACHSQGSLNVHDENVYSNENIRAKWYTVNNGIVDWASGKSVTFPDVTISPDLFNQEGDNLIGHNPGGVNIPAQYIYKYSDYEDGKEYDEKKDPTGKAASTGIYPLVINYVNNRIYDFGFVTGKIVAKKILSNTICLEVPWCKITTPDHDYMIYIPGLIFEWSLIGENMEDLVMRCTNSYDGHSNNYLSYKYDDHNATANLPLWLSKESNGAIGLGYIRKEEGVTLNNGIFYSYSKPPFQPSHAIDDYTYLEYQILKYSQTTKTLTAKILKTGVVHEANSSDASKFTNANEGFAFRESSDGKTYCFLYAATGDTERLDSKGHGYGITICNNLELHCDNDTIYTFDNGINISLRYDSQIEGSQGLTDTSRKISRCFVDLCIVNESQNIDKILTVHQNESTIYVGLYEVDHSKTPLSAKKITTTSFATNNTASSPDQTGGQIILKKIDDSHILFIKNAVDKDEEAEIKIIGVSSSYLYITNVVCNDISKPATYSPYFQTSCNGIDISTPIEITNTKSTGTSVAGDYFVISIGDIYTGKTIDFGITIKSASNTVINYGVYDIDFRVQSTAQLQNIEGIALQSGKADQTVRYVLRDT